MKSILITGAKGFLGSHASKYFKQLGYQVFGLGHGKLEKNESNKIGIDFWKEENVSPPPQETIKKYNLPEQSFDSYFQYDWLGILCILVVIRI